ncbi:MAG: alpha/beta hydrolase [Gammaproteobacteria bacterium]
MTRHISVLLLLLGLFLSPTLALADSFSSDGVDIYYTVEGQGEPVVLIHGFTASGDSNWGAPGIRAALAEDYRVITLDNRGHGASGKPSDVSAYGEQMVQDVINLLDQLGLERSNIVGYSMGGLITQKLVTLYPNRVIKAVIGGVGWMDETSDLATSITLIADSLASGNGIGPLLVALTPAGDPIPSPEQIAAMNQMLLASNDSLALAAAVRGFDVLGQISADELAANQVPLLYLVGERDPLKTDVDRVRGVVTNAKFIVVPGANHSSAFGHPMFLQSLQQFLSATE